MTVEQRSLQDEVTVPERLEGSLTGYMYPARYKRQRHVHVYRLADDAGVVLSLYNNASADTRFPEAYMVMTVGEAINFFDAMAHRLRNGQGYDGLDWIEVDGEQIID